MSPSVEFYKDLEAGEKAVEVEAWKKAYCEQWRKFLCVVTDKSGQDFYALIRPAYYLGGGSIEFPLCYESSQLKGENVIGMLWITQRNQDNFGSKAASDCYQVLDLEFTERYSDFLCSTHGGASGITHSLSIERSIEKPEKWRRPISGRETESAMGLAQHFSDVFGFQVQQVINASGLLSSQTPIEPQLG